MCGIAGLWARELSGEACAAAVTAMTAALRHRGPDSRGRWSSPDGDVALGHARLAIVDLSEAGAQPMVSRSGRYVVVFNGEIYNHAEIRLRLSGDVPWRGHSDTETLLEAIEQWGLAGALRECVGMFAVALWDSRLRTLTLARDRLGEKPLFWSQGRNGLAFASEVKALRLAPGLDLAMDEEALRGYVRFGFVIGTRSAWRGVHKLPAGHFAVFQAAGGDPTLERYWTLPRPPSDAAGKDLGGDEAWLESLDGLLRRSIRGQLMADVPLGAFLSGGIDSSLVVALMQQASTQPVRTFSMGFGREHDDELSAAAETAACLGTHHTELIVTPRDVLDVIPRLGEIYDEPFADASQVPTVLLSALTRRHVTVALTGDAGDELFGGYNRYRSAAVFERRLKGLPSPARRALGSAIGVLPPRTVDGWAAGLRARGMRGVPPLLGEKIARVGQFLAAEGGREAWLGTVSQWIDRPPLLAPSEPPAVEELEGTALPQQMMWWDLQTYLVDDILVKVDRAAMASSLETRVPFLDHRIVEFALGLPLRAKIRDGNTKWLLRGLLKRHLPTLSFDRPKQGFSVPLDEWIRGPLRDWAEALLSADRLSASGLLDVQAVRRVWSEHVSGHRNHLRALWTVLMLQDWREREARATR